MLVANPDESPIRHLSEPWCGLHPEHSELEVKCLVILARNVKHKVEIACHVNKIFKLDAGKSTLAVEISKLEKSVAEQYLTIWQEYHGHPESESKNLNFLRSKLDFNFVTRRSCLRDPREVDDI